jgi:hypothetical protein
MRDQNAQQLLARVMGWTNEESVLKYVSTLQLLGDYKYDHYQKFGPGRRFIESLALWLQRFDSADRTTALDFVMERLIYVSDQEFAHLVQMAYPDVIVQERLRLVAEEQDIAPLNVGAISRHPRFTELRLKSLYLGLSDGARTNELRRASGGEIGNEQIWHAYELGDEKAEDMVDELRDALERAGQTSLKPRFNVIWLLDDFSGSGNTYIRFDPASQRYKGKIPKIYELLHRGHLVDTSHYEVFLLLYVVTRQGFDHIEYWTERFTAEHGYKPIQLRALFVIERETAVTHGMAEELKSLIENPRYYDHRAFDKHMSVGGTDDARLGFAACALPLVLSHNTPNNSIFLLWAPEHLEFVGLFPRVSRHREF